MKAETLITRIKRCRARNIKHQIDIQSNNEKIRLAKLLLKEHFNLDYD